MASDSEDEDIRAERGSAACFLVACGFVDAWEGDLPRIAQLLELLASGVELLDCADESAALDAQQLAVQLRGMSERINAAHKGGWHP